MIGAQVGPFTIVCPLGERGAATMYLAEHAVLKTRRAVKFLPPQRAQDARAVQRFVDEARAAARLHHRNLIQVHDVGQLASGAWFMVLDHLDGGTLARWMADHGGPMALDLIVQIASQIANGLQVAHDHGMLHGGLTPDHVGLSFRDGDLHQVVLLDVGAAQLGAEPPGSAPILGPRSSSPGAATGTPAYLSPEQLRGARLGPAADVFALGVIAYRMTTGGWFPHQYGESRAGYAELPATELYQRQVSGAPVDPRDRAPGLPAAWAEAVLAAIAADPARRPASARAFALGLAEALPASGSSPGGLAIVRSCARELIDASTAIGALPRADLGWRYQLGDRLGGGGMAEVFAATMTGAEGFARRVAIKRVLPELSRIPAFAAMFIAEAQIASRLAHPNIVSVLDFARDAEDRLYLVMEYIDGKDLASVLATGAIPPSLAIFVMIEMLRGLGYAHDLPGRADPASGGGLASGGRGAAGVVHRDVSPQNLLVSYEGTVKLSDFGLAKVRAASGGVHSDVVRGKPSYMSPEQISAEPLDGRADLFAAGVMLWEMLADRPLFTGTAREITAQVMFRDIARPSSFRAGVPADLEAVAMKLLAYQRGDRYPTAQAAIDALLGCADVPRDGRGELAQLLAVRFSATGARGPRGPSAPGEAAALRAGPVTNPAPPSGVVPATSSPVAATRTSAIAGRPRRGMFAATLGMIVLGVLAAALVLARGEVAQSQTTERARPRIAPGPDTPARPDAASARRETAPEDAGIGDARPAAPLAGPAGLVPPAGPAPRPPPRRERVARSGRTGELAIIVRPWAMIWLNGKPSGQTPFRAAVPAGRYRVRLANDDAGHDEVTTVTVEPDRTATVERSW